VQQDVRPVMHGQDILWIQQLVRQVPASQHMVDYAVDLVRATRPKEPPSPDFVKNWLAWGAGPRAAQYLILGAKARAVMHGRFAVTADDIRALAFPVLRHRIFTNFNADAEGIDAEQVIEKLIETIPEPTYGEPLPAGKRKRASKLGAQTQAATPAATSSPPAPTSASSAAPLAGRTAATSARAGAAFAGASHPGPADTGSSSGTCVTAGPDSSAHTPTAACRVASGEERTGRPGKYATGRKGTPAGYLGPA